MSSARYGDFLRGKEGDVQQGLRVWKEDLVGHATLVHVVGDVDLAGAGLLERQLCEACADLEPCRTVVVDLRGVGFFGSIGLSLLLSAHRRCQEQNVRLIVVVASQGVRRPLDVTGLSGTLHVVSTLAEAFSVAPEASPHLEAT
jgi:anti-sigma B factor antagonist